MQYSRQKFLAALALGRGLRYGILAYLGILYGRQFLRFFNRYTKPTMYVLIGLAVIAGIMGLITYLRYQRNGENPKALQPAN